MSTRAAKSRLRKAGSTGGKSMEDDFMSASGFDKKPCPCRVRLCFGTSSEQLGRVGCFRLPWNGVGYNRRSKSLVVQFTVRVLSRWPRTGQGKFLTQSWQRTQLFLLHHPCQSLNYDKASSRKALTDFFGRRTVFARGTQRGFAEAAVMDGGCFSSQPHCFHLRMVGCRPGGS